MERNVDTYVGLQLYMKKKIGVLQLLEVHAGIFVKMMVYNVGINVVKMA